MLLLLLLLYLLTCVLAYICFYYSDNKLQGNRDYKEFCMVLSIAGPISLFAGILLLLFKFLSKI